MFALKDVLSSLAIGILAIPTMPYHCPSSLYHPVRILHHHLSFWVCTLYLNDVSCGKQQFHNRFSRIAFETHSRCYRLCVLASGSLTMVTIWFFTLIRLSFLHLGQYNGKFINFVSFLIFVRVLFPQTGHIIHCWLIIIFSLFFLVHVQ